MNTYNEVPHSKIPKAPLNELIRNMISYGHKKDKVIVNEIFDYVYQTGLSPLTDLLATMDESELSKVLNVIVRETEKKKSELEK